MSLSSLDLNLLLVLDTVLVERSVARAARRLHVTPPAISNALARLRGVLGDPLVVRSGRGVVPTPRTKALAPGLAHALRALEAALQGDAFDPSTTDRELTLAIADAGQVVKLPAIVAAMSSRMPRARLRIASVDRLLSSGGLAQSEVDVLIGVGEHGPGIRVLPLYDETIVLVARADHPGIRRRLSVASLAALRHVEVQVAPGKGSRAVAEAYGTLGIERDIALVVPTFAAAAAVAAGSDLVASLPATVLEALGPGLGLRRLPTPLPPIRTTIRLLWHDRTDADPVCAAFRAILVDAVTHSPLRPRRAHAAPTAK